MFTGIIEGLGRVARREPCGGDLRLSIDTGTLPFERVQPGESIAVSGVCLTVVAFGARDFVADVSNETLACTTLGGLREGSAVNLERAMLPTTRFGGHVVAGHVDGVGLVASIGHDGRSQRWRFEPPLRLMRYIAAKGSICVDGVSLTVNDVDTRSFGVNLVPHTLAHTIFGGIGTGAPVNLEVDLMARYAERLASFER
jgi:riboflavin synthase